MFESTMSQKGTSRGTSFRQMSITECFSKVKACFPVDDTDSELETPLSEFDETPTGKSADTSITDPNNFVSVNAQSAITDSFSTSQSSTKSGESSQTKSAVKRKMLFEGNHNDKITKLNDKEMDAKLVTPSTPKIPLSERIESTGTVKNHSSIKKSPATPKKTQIIDQHQPSTSKTPLSSPSKSTGGSPKRKNGSPSKDSPRKNRELKSLKAKEGKQLQIRQLNELVRLFNEVTSSIHLKELLNTKNTKNRSSISILERFEKMEEDQKYFVMKLFICKKSWYNIFRSKAQLHITNDDKRIFDIYEYMREEKFVHTDYKKSKNLLELLDQLDTNDLNKIMTELGIGKKEREEKKQKETREKKKKRLIGAISTAIRRQRTLTELTLEDRVRDEIEKKMGLAVKIRDNIYQAFFHAYTLGTFTNDNFDDPQAFFRQMTEFCVVFPETNLEDYPVFYSREKFVLYAKASQVRKELDDILGNRAIKAKDKIADICTTGINAYNNLIGPEQDDCSEHKNAPHLKRFSARHVYCSVLSTCCKHVPTKMHREPNEVKKWLECLIKQFPDSRKVGFWYHSLITLHMNVINYETAAKILIDVLETKSDRLTENYKLKLAALARELKSSKIEQLYHDRIVQLAPKAITDNFPKARIDFKKGHQEMTTMSVEDVALDYYSKSGFPGGKHCEGSLIKALLMLYFWDIIYNPEIVIPGTFISKLQIAPLDMFTRYFYEKRQEPIRRRLMELESEWSVQHLLEFATENWKKHSHELNPFGAIELTIPDIATVKVLVTVLGRKVMAKVFERLIKDLTENSSGMPDLLVWNVDEKIHKFVKVKREGGRDQRLAPNQMLWLDYLQKAGASIEVCLVHSMGSKRKIAKMPIMNETGGEEVNSDQNENA